MGQTSANSGYDSQQSTLLHHTAEAAKSFDDDKSTIKAAVALGGKPPPFRTYKMRFFALILGTLLAGLQGAFWGNWGPISVVSKPVFG